MPIALHPLGRASQSRHGVGARLVRRLGGAVRSAIVGGIALASALRRPAPSQTSQDHAAAQHPEAPPPRRVPLPRRPSAALPAPSPLPPWLAPLLARRRRRPACLNHGDAPFTPEAYPQLSPKACAVLNTPLEECDPKTLELLISTFTQYINQVMAPEAATADPQAALPNLWHRISTALADIKADTSFSATPQPVPATPADKVPDAPVASLHPPAPPTAPAMPSAKDAPSLSPLPLSGPPADATITTVAPKTPPEIAAPSAPVLHRSLRYDTQSFACSRRHFRCCRPLFPRGVLDRPQCLPPPWRLYYAACTGPP